MPDKAGALTPEEMQQARDWIDRHRKSAECPICSNHSWRLTGHITSAVVVSEPVPGQYTLALAGNLYPEVQCWCSVCGYTQIYNAVMMGIGSLRQFQEAVAEPAKEMKSGTDG